jgi:DHA2 family methylenomycin A resistance protein-like MFS transporter
VGWPSIFLINVVVGALALIAAAERVAPVPAGGGRIDIGGQLTAALAIGGLTFAIIEAPRVGWASSGVLVALAASLLGATGFVACERRVADPMLPPALAGRPIFKGAAAIGALFQFAFYGQVFVLSLLLQQARGESPLRAGLSFLPMTGLVAVSNLFAPRIVQRLGQLTTIAIGELILACGFVGLIPIEPHSPWWTIALAMLPIGIGAGLIIVPLTDRLLTGVPPDLAGVASGAFNASRQVGAAISVALFGAVLTGGRTFISEARLTFALAAAATLLTVPVTRALRSKTDMRPTRRNRAQSPRARTEGLSAFRNRARVTPRLK